MSWRRRSAWPDGANAAFAPTSIGLEMVEQARALLKDAEDLVDVALAAQDPLSGPLQLEIIPTVGPFILPKIMPRLHEAAPRPQDLPARGANGRTLIGRLEAGRLDAVILALPAPLADVDAEDLALDRFHLVCPRRHRLASMPTPSAPPDLASEDLLLLEDGHCLTGHALAACALEGARRNVASTSGGNLMTLVQMVAIGLGVTLAPGMAIEAGLLRGLDLHAAPLEGEAPFRRIALAGARRPAKKTFLRLTELLPRQPGEGGDSGEAAETLPICRRVKVALSEPATIWR